MRHPFLIGGKLYLRPLEPSDLDGPYLGWLNDPATTRFLETGRFPTTRTALEDALRTSGNRMDQFMLAIVDRRTDKHVGNIKLGPINWVHRYGSLGILLGNPAYRGKGYGREAIELALQHAFTQLGLQKVTAGAYGDHAACLALFKGLGFSVEGCLRSHLYREGRYYDKIVMGLQREAYLQRHATDDSSQRVSARRNDRPVARRVAGMPKRRARPARMV